MRPIFIAEVKTESPFGFKAKESWEERLELACEHGDWVAVHVDPRWGGSLKLLKRARKRTKKPLVAKGAAINLSREYAAAGANYLHVVTGSLEGLSGRLIVEPTLLTELARFPANVLVCWNERCLCTGQRHPTGTFAVARRIYPGWLCQASFIRTPADVHPEADAILVGEHLPEFVKTWRCPTELDTPALPPEGL